MYFVQYCRGCVIDHRAGYDFISVDINVLCFASVNNQRLGIYIQRWVNVNIVINDNSIRMQNKSFGVWFYELFHCCEVKKHGVNSDVSPTIRRMRLSQAVTLPVKVSRLQWSKNGRREMYYNTR